MFYILLAQLLTVSYETIGARHEICHGQAVGQAIAFMVGPHEKRSFL